MSKADPLEAYQAFLAIKRHFTSDYDYFRYHGKTKGCNKESFLKRKDQQVFFRIVNVYQSDEIVPAIVSNFLADPQVWSGDIASREGQQHYHVYKKIHDSLEYIFQEDLRKLFESVEQPTDIFKSEDGKNPPILNAFYDQEIHLETFIILNAIRPFFQDLDKLNDTVLWPRQREMCEKYKPFIKFEPSAYMEILKKVLKNADRNSSS